MRRYEYRLIDTGQDIEARLNGLGTDGWQSCGRNDEEAATDRPARCNHLERRVPIVGLDQTGEAVIGSASRTGCYKAKNGCENGTLHCGLRQSTSGPREL